MKKCLLIFCAAALCLLVTGDAAVAQGCGWFKHSSYALHVAGPPGAGTCDYKMTDCLNAVTSLVSPLENTWDIYVIAMNVQCLGGARYGIKCEVALGGGFYFNGWTNCADFEIPSPGWPGCGEDNAQAWITAQTGPHVTMGILDVYTYAATNAKICTKVDSRVGFAEFCSAHQPLQCCRVTTNVAFGCVGINRLGYNPCEAVPVERTSWGAVKALYN